MKVHVTVGDIAHGCRGSLDSCPLALAVRRVLPPALAIFGVGVTRPGIVLLDVGEVVRSWTNSADVARWIMDFDAGAPVAPFEFELEENAAAEPAQNGKES